MAVRSPRPRRGGSGPAKRALRRRRGEHLSLENLESRRLLSGTWTELTNPVPDGTGTETMLLLTDGTVIAQAGGGDNGGINNQWYKLTPDSTGSYVNGTWTQLANSNGSRLYYSSQVLQDGDLYVAGGEYDNPVTGGQTEGVTGEIYDPATNVWTKIPDYPEGLLGDAVSELLPDGNVLEAQLYNSNIFNVTTDTWSPGPSPINGDSYNEEGFVKMGDGSTLDYQIQSTITPNAVRLIQGATDAQDQWVDAGQVPVSLTDPDDADELGPAELLANGDVFWTGASNFTALYTPPTPSNPQGTWVAGPDQVDANGNPIEAADAPSAMETDGDVLWAASPGPADSGNGPTTLQEYDPNTNKITIVPDPPGADLSGPAYTDRMLDLPSGQVLFSNGYGNNLYVYTPASPQLAAAEPTVSGVTVNNGVYTLTGTQLNGIDEGANYGDDVQDATNYPIIKLTSSSGKVSFAKSTDWSSTWVDTGNTPETVQFTLPSTDPQGTYTLNVVTNGVSSANYTFNTQPLNITPVTPTGVTEEVPFTGEVAKFLDPNPGDVSEYSAEITWGDGTSSAATVQTDPAGGYDVIGHTTYAVGGSYSATITVSKSGGTPLTATTSETIVVSADPINTTSEPLQPVEDEPFSGEVADFVDTYPLATTSSDYTISIDWGDNITTAPTSVVPDGSGGFEVFGTHTYTSAVSTTAVVTIDGLGGASATVDDAVTVLPAVNLTPAAFTPTIGVAYSGEVATFTSNDPSSPAASTFDAQISWGDGSTSTGVVTLGAGNVYEVSATKTYLQVGRDVVSISITDGFGATASVAESVEVQDATITPLGGVFQAVEGTPYSGPVATFQDPYASAPASYFAATITWGDGSTGQGTVLSDGDGEFEVDGEHVYTQAKSYITGVTISDISGGTAPLTPGTADVAFATLTPLPVTLTVVAGKPLSGVVGSFGDPDAYANSGDFSAEILWGDGTSSAGTVRPNSSGGYDVLGTKTYTNVADLTAQVLVYEGVHLSTTINSSIDVTASPLSASGESFSDVEGDATTPHVVAEFSDADTITQPASYYSATINWGDGSASTGTVVAIVGGGFAVDGSHAYQAGTYPVVVVISDIGGASATAGSTATITPAALTAGTPEAITGAEGSPITQPLGTFTDGNIYAPATNFAATINWGDGTTTPGVITALGGGEFSVSGPLATPHAYASGTFLYAVVVTDYAGPTTTITGSASISPAAIAAQGDPISAQEGFTFNGLIASFTDTAPQVNPDSSFVVTINWGDGSSSAGTVTSPSTGLYDVTGGHDYTAGGTYAVTTTIVSRGGAVATTTSPAIVTSATLTASGSFLTPSEGVAYTGPVATFTDADPIHPAARSFVAIIDWGDDSESIGTVTFDPSTNLYSVSGSHVYNSGAFSVGVSISDSGGATASAVSTALVADSAITAKPTSFAATEAQAFSGVVATFTDADPRSLTPDHFRAAIYWGDGAVSAGTIAVVPGGYAVTGDHIYNTVGSQVVGVLIQSVGGSSATTRSAATVAAGSINVAVTSIAATQDAPFSGVVASFTDSDPFLPASDFAAEISWGDGNVSAGSVVQIAPGSYQVVGGHTYSEGGPASISVSVTGSGGSSGTSGSAGLLVPVADQVYPITISLDTASDTGSSNTDAVTADQTPILEGTAEPGAVVSLFAERSPVPSMIALGNVQADATGHWLLQVGPLSTGSYSLFASAVDAAGRPSTPLTALPIGTQPALVIDDTPPTVVSTSLDPTSETFTIVYGDDLSGVSPAAVFDSAIYELSEPFAAGAPSFAPSSVVNPYPGSSGTSEVVQVTFNVPKRDRSGKLVLTIQGADVADLAGNTLVESHYIPLPSRGDRPGSTYQAQFVTNGKTSSGPEQYFSPAELKGAAHQRKLTTAGHARKR